MNAIGHVVVVIPACNEQESIGACLASVRRARATLRADRPEVSVSVTVVLDACTDATAAVVSAVGAGTVHSTARCVGTARRLGTFAALAAVPCPPSSIWTAHTDADSLVPADWLVRQVRLANAGHDAVLGTVEPDLDRAALRRWRSLHDHCDGHPHVHGANLGIRADALAVIGGWRDLGSGEDVDLAARAVLAELAVARVGGSPVRTSARRHGRAPHGFSSFLRALDALPPDAVRGTASVQAVADAPSSA